jgi:hypothetical protein
MKANGRKTRDGAMELTPTRIAPTTPDTGSTISVKVLESSPTLRSLLLRDLRFVSLFTVTSRKAFTNVTREVGWKTSKKELGLCTGKMGKSISGISEMIKCTVWELRFRREDTSFIMVSGTRNVLLVKVRSEIWFEETVESVYWDHGLWDHLVNGINFSMVSEPCLALEQSVN